VRDGAAGGRSSWTWADNPPRVGPPPCGGTLRQAVTDEPAVALTRRRSGSEAAGSSQWRAFAHGRLREASRRRADSRLAEVQCSPEAPALPGSGPVRGHTPQTGDAMRPLCPRTGAAARSCSNRPGRRVPQRATTATPGGFSARNRDQGSRGSPTVRPFCPRRSGTTS
jgi:hypothetical protein